MVFSRINNLIISINILLTLVSCVSSQQSNQVENDGFYLPEDTWQEQKSDNFLDLNNNNSNEISLSNDNLDFENINNSNDENFANPIEESDELFNDFSETEKISNSNKEIIDQISESQENSKPKVKTLPKVQEPIVSVENDVNNILWWLGVDYKRNEKKLLIECVTIGRPIYDLKKPIIKKDKIDLVFVFKNTTVRKKLLRPLIINEFQGPLSLIKAKYIKENNSTEITLTLRDNVTPKVFSKNGNLLISFDVADEYFGNNTVLNVNSQEAQKMDQISLDSDWFTSGVHPLESQAQYLQRKASNTEANFEVEKNIDLDEIESPSLESDIQFKEINVNKNSFESSQNLKYKVSDFTLFGVAQDNFEDNNLGSDSDFNFEENNSEINNTQINNSQNGFNDNNIEFDDSDLEFNENDVEDLNTNSANQFNANINEFNNVMNENTVNTNNEMILNDGDQFNENETQANITKEKSELNPAANELSDNVVEGSSLPVEVKNSVLQPISMEFKGASLREVIRTFSLENKVNFIFPDSIGDKKVNLNFNNVPWDEALQAVLETHSLGLSKDQGKNANVIRIDTLKNLSLEKVALEKAKKSALHLLATKVLVVRLSYAKAADVVKVLKSMLQSFNHDKRTKVEADARTNSVIVEAVPTALSKIKSLITRIDLQTPQVKIDTRIVEVIDDDNLNLGINWALPLRTDQSKGLGLGNLVFPNQIQSAFSVDTGIDPASRANRTSADMHFGSINNLFELDVRLRMAERKKQVKSLQNNSVVVLDNEEAEAKVAQTIYLEIPSADGDSALSSVEYALKLVVTPHITADGSVQMDIQVENSSAEPGEKAIPDKNSRFIKTRMLRESGETAVIGGVYTTEYSEAQSGIPFLSSLPLIGFLFRNKTFAESKRELIIMVTPSIVNSARSIEDNSVTSNSHVARSNSTQENSLQQASLSQDIDSINFNNNSNEDYNSNRNFSNQMYKSNNLNSNNKEFNNSDFGNNSGNTLSNSNDEFNFDDENLNSN